MLIVHHGTVEIGPMLRRAAFGCDDYVGRLEVAMDHALFVSIFRGVAQLVDQRQGGFVR